MSLFQLVIYENPNLVKISHFWGRGMSQPSANSTKHVKTMELVLNEVRDDQVIFQRDKLPMKTIYHKLQAKLYNFNNEIGVKNMLKQQYLVKFYKIGE